VQTLKKNIDQGQKVEKNELKSEKNNNNNKKNSPTGILISGKKNIN
jgi:hypothetical protein